METKYFVTPRKTSRLNRRVVVTLFTIFIMLVMYAITLTLSFMESSKSSHDSGVTACRQIVIDKKAAVNTPDDNMTAAQRDEKKAKFTNSQYVDLQVSGANVIDTVFVMDRSSSDLAQSYANMAKIEALWGNLQVACLNHGVSIPGLG